MGRHSILRKGNRELVERLQSIYTKERKRERDTDIWSERAKNYWLHILHGDAEHEELLKLYDLLQTTFPSVVYDWMFTERFKKSSMETSFSMAVKEIYGNTLTRQQLYQLFYIAGYFYNPRTPTFYRRNAHQCLDALSLSTSEHRWVSNIKFPTSLVSGLGRGCSYGIHYGSWSNWLEHE